MKFTNAIALFVASYAQANTDKTEGIGVRPGFKPGYLPDNNNVGSNSVEDFGFDADVVQYDMRDSNVRDDVYANGISMKYGEEIALLFRSNPSTGFNMYYDDLAGDGLWTVEEEYMNNVGRPGASGVKAYVIAAEDDGEGSSTFRTIEKRGGPIENWENFDQSQYQGSKMVEIDIRVEADSEDDLVLESSGETSSIAKGAIIKPIMPIIPIDPTPPKKCEKFVEHCTSRKCEEENWAPVVIQLDRMNYEEDSHQLVHVFNRQKLHIEISDGYQRAYDWGIDTASLVDMIYNDAIEFGDSKEGFVREWDFKIKGCDEEFEIVFKGTQKGETIYKRIGVMVLSDPYYTE